MKNNPPTIESLESRIAPALLNPAGTLLTYTDIDGDLVHVAFTHAKMAAGDFMFSTGSVDGTITTPQALSKINLMGKTGAGFALTATPLHGKGDSHANIAEINGISTNLGSISVDGDVGVIEAGTGAAGTVGLQSFTALSLGASNPTVMFSTIVAAGSIHIKTDILDAGLNINAGAKSITVGGSLIGEAENNSARIYVATGDVGVLKIGGSVIGGAGAGAGSIDVVGNVGALSIGGSVVGFTGTPGTQPLPQIDIGTSVKTVFVGGDLRGRDIDHGGFLSIGSAHGASVTSIKIGGSLIGSDQSNTGEIYVRGDVKTIAIGHDIIGGSSTHALSGSGAVLVGSRLGSITVGGSLVAGVGLGGLSPALTDNGIISIADSAGSITIGNIRGQTGDGAANAAYVTVGGFGVTAGNSLGSLTVKGSAIGARIVAGYDYGFGLENVDASVGSITIGGNFTGSNIAVGFTAGADGLPGTDDDQGGSTVATIGSVKIGGAFQGVAGDAKFYYIEAPHLKNFKVGHASYTEAQLDAAGSLALDSIGTALVESFG